MKCYPRQPVFGKAADPTSNGVSVDCELFGFKFNQRGKKKFRCNFWEYRPASGKEKMDP